MNKRAIISFSGFQESEDNRNGFEDGFFRIVSAFAKPGEIYVYAPRT